MPLKKKKVFPIVLPRQGQLLTTLIQGRLNSVERVDKVEKESHILQFCWWSSSSYNQELSGRLDSYTKSGQPDSYVETRELFPKISWVTGSYTMPEQDRCLGIPSGAHSWYPDIVFFGLLRISLGGILIF